MFELERIGGALGAALPNLDLSHALAEPEQRAALLELAVHHQVLFLPDQQISPEHFAELAALFGRDLPHPAYPRVPGAPTVQILESTEAAPSKIELWHSDMTFSPQPPDWTLLHGQIIPAWGGDTLWASAATAYEQLSAPMRALIDPLVAVHDFRHGFRESLAEPGGAERLAGAIAENPPVRHPVVRIHPISGRPALYVNPLFTTHIEGLSPRESEALLALLYEHQVQPEFTVRLRWSPKTLVIWDNRSTLHKPINDYFPQHRLLHRVTIAGERRPVGKSQADTQSA